MGRRLIHLTRHLIEDHAVEAPIGKQPPCGLPPPPDTKPTGHSVMPPAKVDQWLGAGTGETLESSLTTSMRSRFPRARARQPGNARHAYPTRARPSPLSLAAAASLRQ